MATSQRLQGDVGGFSVAATTTPLSEKLLLTIRKDQSEIYLIVECLKSGDLEIRGQGLFNFSSKSTTQFSSNTPKNKRPNSSPSS